MKMGSRVIGLRIANMICLLAMIVCNIVFELIPLNGVTTAEVSGRHDTLLTPPGYVFAIWGVIYLFLILAFLFMLDFFNGQSHSDNPEIVKSMSFYFLLSCVANVAWIITWHYGHLLVSLGFTFFLWLTLNYLTLQLRPETKTKREKILVQAPFSIYYAWSTAALFLNMTVVIYDARPDLLVQFGALWTFFVIIALFLLGLYYTIRYKDYAYSAVVIWVFIGLFVKNVTVVGNSTNLAVLLTTMIGAFLLLIVIGVVIWTSRNKAKMAQRTGDWRANH